MPKSQIWIFGNPDLEQDSLPLKILPKLKKQLPNIDFVVKDPNEEWDLPKHLTIIDTIHGLKKITVFTSLKDFSIVPRLTMHDFDLLTNLRWLSKLDKLPPFTIIGIPLKAKEKEIINNILNILNKKG
jgi:ADP-heptose:LPS heptosyltransferase